MAGLRINIMELRQIIRLKKEGISNRKVADMLHLRRNTVNDYVRIFETHKLDYNDLSELDDAALISLFPCKSEINHHRYNILSSYFNHFDLPKTEIEQTSIASILSKTDQAIASTEALIAKYSKIKTGLMQDLLTKGIDENGNIRTEETHGFTEENGFKYPKEWELTTIEKCIINIEQGWSPNCESDPAPTNEWGILKTTAVTWNGYDANENKKMPIALTPKYQYEVKNGDVLVTRAGPNSRVGVVSYVQQTRDKIIFSDKIYRLIPQKKLLNKYLALALSSQFTQRHLSNFKTGMAESQTNISQKIVLALNILLPSPEEQKQIIETLDKAEENLKIYGIVLSKLISIKTGLMQDLLTGKVRVKI